MDLIVERIPAPEYEPDHPLQAHVTNLDAYPYVGRLALCRVRNGTIRAGQADRLVPRGRRRSSARRSPTSTSPRRSTGSRPTRPGPGEIIAVAGLPEVTIGETLADPEDPRPLPVITVDEPSLSMTVGINTSPLAGRDGSEADRAPDQETASTRSWSATSRSASSTPSGPTPGRSRAAASCSW